MKEANAHAHSSMAHALTFPRDNPLFRSHQSLSVRKGQFIYQIDTRGEQTTYSVSDGNQTLSAPVTFVFGVHNQTYLIERDGQTVESLVSFYRALGGLDTTIGDEVVHPQTLYEAFGRPLFPGEREDCAGCHSSLVIGGTVVSIPQGEVTGVTCERCHTDALAHQSSALKGGGEYLPEKLGQKTPSELNEICGQCHRTWESVVRGHKTGVIDNVRMQPYRLTNSRCFDGLDKRLSCIACHDPHQPVISSTAAVDKTCLSCHSTAVAPTAVDHIQPHICPVETKNCAGCHMARVPLMNGDIVFNDHEIRIARPGDKYPN